MSVTMIIFLAIVGEFLLAVAVGKVLASGDRPSAARPVLGPDSPSRLGEPRHTVPV